MESRTRSARNLEGEASRAGAIQEQAVRMLADPAFRPPRLFRRCLNRPTNPSLPSDFDVAGLRQLAILVRKEKDVVFEHDDQVGELFAVCVWTSAPLIAVESRIAPQGQEGPTAELTQVA